MKKIRYFIKVTSNIIIIYTNYTSTIGIVKQISINTTSIKKLNLKLIYISEYLQRFRIKLKYKFSKANIVLNILLYFINYLYRLKIDELIFNILSGFLVNIIAVSDDFKGRIYNNYEIETRQVRIITTVIKNTILGENITRLLYKFINNLLYFNNIEYKYRVRLYLPTALEYKVFQKIYNNIEYFNYTRIYKKLVNSIYIFNILTKLYKYLRYYPYYQLY